jgi:hypothetical protein
MLHSRPMPKSKTKANQTTRDFLLRDLRLDVAERLKVAASLHRTPMKDYIQTVLEVHLKELEQKGITLSLPKVK